MQYKLFYAPRAGNELHELDKSVQIQLLKKISALPSFPEIGKPLSNVLKNKRSIHVGKYRVVYIVDKVCKQTLSALKLRSNLQCNEKQDIIVVRVCHRKDVYI